MITENDKIIRDLLRRDSGQSVRTVKRHARRNLGLEITDEIARKVVARRQSSTAYHQSRAIPEPFLGRHLELRGYQDGRVVMIARPAKVSVEAPCRWWLGGLPVGGSKAFKTEAEARNYLRTIGCERVIRRKLL